MPRMSRRRLRIDDAAFSAQPNPPAWDAGRDDIMTLLQEAEIDECGLIPWGSNYTFLVTLRHPTAGCSYAVYKPRRGEAPLYDFPEGTLFRRERAAYVVDQALGWGLVPPTVVRDGPYGIGMAQLFVDADTNAHYFTFGPEVPDVARRIALFDCVVNNGDRKAGHLLRGQDGRVWAIDHGLTFHTSSKLRTVIWDFAGEALPPRLVRDLSALLPACTAVDGPLSELRTLLSGRECEALRRRVERLLDGGIFPQPTSYRSVPWPAV